MPSLLLLSCCCHVGALGLQRRPGQSGCDPSLPSSLIIGADKTGVIPNVRASSGLLFNSIECDANLKCFSFEITSWWSIFLTLDTLQCDPDTAA